MIDIRSSRLAIDAVEADRENFVRDSVSTFNSAVSTELVGIDHKTLIVRDDDFDAATRIGAEGSSLLLADALTDLIVAVNAKSAVEFESRLVGATVSISMAFAHRRLLDSNQC